MTGKNCYIKSKKFCKFKHNRGLTLLSVILTFFVGALTFFFLIQANSLVSSNFKIRDYQKEIKELQNNVERMEINIAKWQSPANLESLVGSLNMVEAGEIVYLGEEKVMAVRE